jgi:hypothetical protein
LFTLLLVGSVASCKTGQRGRASETAGDARTVRLGCDHTVEANALAKHSWPHPADVRDLRWVGGYHKMRLKLKPAHAAFVTATVTWKKGDLIEVQDSQIRITKPRRLVAKRDLFVKRKVWDQGIRVERDYLAAARGEVASFFFYNSRGMCMVGTEEGPGWTPCTLDDAFEGLSADDPHPCEQEWWVKVEKSRIDKGWMIVDLSLMERVPPPDDAAR